MGVWPAYRGRWGISARFAIATPASGRPPDLPPAQFATIGEERTRTV